MKDLKILIVISLLSLFSAKIKSSSKTNSQNSEAPIVYFTRNLTSQAVVDIYKKLNPGLSGKLALKVHSGELKGPYFLKPSYLNKIYKETNGTFVECNAAYNMTRHTTAIHKKTLEGNGWYNESRQFELMDENEEDVELPIDEPRVLESNYVGRNFFKYKSCLVLAHFKGHKMGGYGGALKQLSIGFSSRGGKTNIHTGGKTRDYLKMKEFRASRKVFTTAMAEAASSVVKYFRNNGGIAFINVIKDVSVACDCGTMGIPPRINDIGILASTDPVAIDQAALDLVLGSGDEGVEEWKNQLDDLLGENTLHIAELMGVGSRKYQLVEITTNNSNWIKYSLLLFLGLISIIIF